MRIPINRLRPEPEGITTIGSPTKQRMNIQEIFDEQRQPKGKLISIVLPVYNESECLPQVVEELYDFLGKNLSEYNFEISFIDDRSKDNSFAILSKLS